MLVNISRAELLTTFFVCVFLKIIKIKLFNLLLSFMLACVVLPLRVYCAPSCPWEYWMCICCKRIGSKSMYLRVRVYVPVCACMCVYLRTYNCIYIYIHLYLYLHFLQREKSCMRPCVCVYSRKVTISCPAVVVAAVLAPSIDRGSKCQSSSAAAAVAAASMSALLLFLLLLLLL